MTTQDRKDHRQVDNSTNDIGHLDIRVTHIEHIIGEIKATVQSTNERVDQIYTHLISGQTNSSNRKASWKQWGGATVLSILALGVTLWEKFMSPA